MWARIEQRNVVEHSVHKRIYVLLYLELNKAFVAYMSQNKMNVDFKSIYGVIML